MKKGFRYYTRIYRKILAQDLKSKMSYRADFMISMFGMILTNVAGFMSFWIIFQNFPSVNGWNYHEMLFMYGFSLVALTPMQCLFDNNWNLRFHVRSGDFIKYCFRPINLFFYYMSEIFDIKGLGQLLIGAGIITYAWVNLKLAVSVSVILLLLIALVTSSLFMIAIMNIAAAACFWIINSSFIIVFASNFRDYAKYPVTIYNAFFKFIFTFIIPIAFIAYYPSQIWIMH